jgi:hypothetical protein
MKILLALILALPAFGCLAQTNAIATNQAAGKVPAQVAKTPAADEAEQIRKDVVDHRRFICGRVMQIVPDGLVVESGYTSLLNPPPPSWVIPGNVTATRDPHAVEAVSPDSVCIGLVFITDFPRRPPVKRYDYVLIHGYPAGEYDYAPLPGIHKTLRRFAGGVERAVTLNLQAREKKSPQ